MNPRDPDPSSRSPVPGAPDRRRADAPEGSRQADLALVQSILRGSEAAWHGFVHRYTPLIRSVLRRCLFDGEGVDTVYANVLESLYKRKLATWEGRAALSTWLIVICRTEAMDHLRREFGRRALPGRLKRLSPEDQEVFRRYHLEGWPLEAVGRSLGDPCREPLCPHLEGALARIDETLDRNSLRRAVYTLRAESTGAAAGRLLEFLDRQRVERELAEAAESPDRLVMERELRALQERVLRVVASLPEEERRVLSLRFEEGRTARETAEELGIHPPKRVYRIVERILGRLRARIDSGNEGESDLVRPTP